MKVFKKLLLLALTLLPLLTFVACEEDEPELPAPTIAALPTTISARQGASVQVTLAVSAAAGIRTITATGGTVNIPAVTANATAYANAATITVGSANAQITFTVTDNRNRTATATVAVTVAANPAPSISGIPATASVAPQAQLGPVNAVFTATDGLATLTITKNGAAFATQNFTGNPTSATVPFTYTPTNAEANSTITFVFTATDTDGSSTSFTHTLTVTAIVNQTITLLSSYKGLADYPGFDATTKTLKMLKSNVYILDGFVYVNDGQTLDIEAGTLIKGRPGQGGGASALIVARGGKILANGTATEPIVMTGVADDLAGSVPDNAGGLWGGLVILGTATNNECANLDGSGACFASIEGIPTTEPRGIYGYGDTKFVGEFGNLTDASGNLLSAGTQKTYAKGDDFSSGILKYVSVRHAGSIIGGDSEINGITFGAVASPTEVDYVEVWVNLDDGIEFFGGDVNVKHFAVSWAGDDALDYDLGYDGYMQYGLVWINDAVLSSSDPRAGEFDGGNSPDEARPYGSPVFSNVTFVGDAGLQQMILYRDNAGGELWNSIFTNFQNPLVIEDRSGIDSYDRFLAGQPSGNGEHRIWISNNIFWEVAGQGAAGNSSINGVFRTENQNGIEQATTATLQAAFGPVNNLVSPGFGNGINAVIPAANGAASQNIGVLPEGTAFFGTPTWRGAFQPGVDPWIKGWTKAYQVLTR